MESEGKYTENFWVSTQIGQIHGNFLGIHLNRSVMRKLSGYPPKSECYAETFRIINSYFDGKITIICSILGTLKPLK